jgi:chemotaxis protein MotB
MDGPQHPTSEGGAPEYMVSYADMITIMLAFFIVLYASTGTTASGKNKNEKSSAAAGQTDSSGAEAGKGGRPTDENGQNANRESAGKNKKTGDDEGEDGQIDARMQQVFKSLRYRFGPEWTITNCWAGGPSELRNTATFNASRGAGVHADGRATWGQIGNDSVRARAQKPTDQGILGGRIYFNGSSAAIDGAESNKLHDVAEDLIGKNQRVEVRGHASRQPLPKNSPYRDSLDLAYARARSVRDALVAQGVEARRIRLGVAGDNEPIESDDGNLLPIRHNARVEIHMLHEYTQPPGSDPQHRDLPAGGKPVE